MYDPKRYRSWTASADLVSFEVVEKQTDIAVYAERDLARQARAAVLTCRQEIESYIGRDPRFYSSLEPLDADPGAPEIVKAMAAAGRSAGVGPMAAVAGAVAEAVGRSLGHLSGEIIVENGGDIFIVTAKKRTLGVYAGEVSPFTGTLVLEVGPAPNGLGVCTSSGTVSHSLSFGRADAVLIIAGSAALADAAATATGNIVKSPEDVQKAIEFARSVPGIRGAVVAMKESLGSWGDIRFV